VKLRGRTGCARWGFTLIEVVVAIVILGFGVLALARTSSALTRLISESALRTDVDAVAGSQMEWLRGRACSGGAFSGAEGKGVLTVSWSVEAAARRRELMVVVESPHRTETRVDSVRSYVVCVEPS
jgi:prepilin-type N-terminal cleavage/methylation domain-containing protein